MTIHKVYDSQKLQDACNKAAAGDTILIFGGNYTQKSVMRGKSGRPDAPIRFIGGDSVVIDAGRLPEHIEWHAEKNGAKTGPPPHPKPKDFSFLQLFDCHHVVIENLRVANCWPSIFYFEQSANLVVRGCVLLDATYAIYCTGPATSHVLVENNTWQQDSSPGHLLWTTIEWTSAHGGAGGDDKHRYFNGGFVSGKNIAGAFVIRGNQISDAYNGIRLLCDPDMETDGDGIPRNAGIHIHDNDFIRIRDNPTEPEEYAHDWHVRHNRLLDCYAWFSFDGAGGGYWYFYGNTADFTSRPGLLRRYTACRRGSECCQRRQDGEPLEQKTYQVNRRFSWPMRPPGS